MEKVAVLMSAYNGEKYISEQVESILNQRNVDIKLIIRDDGSTDGTRRILTELAKSSKIEVILGHNIGYTASFMQLISVILNRKFDYVAFSDQDDKWLPEKIFRAISQLQQVENVYKLYFSALTFTDQDEIAYGEKSYSKYRISLESSMVMSSVAGCTMVISGKLAAKIYVDGKIIPDGVGHDGWIYRCCLAFHGKVIYDDISNILFRRHDNNTSKAGGHFMQKLSIASSLYVQRNTEWDTANVILNSFSDLPLDSLNFLASIVNYKKNLISKLKLILNPKLSSGKPLIDIVIKALILVGRY